MFNTHRRKEPPADTTMDYVCQFKQVLVNGLNADISVLFVRYFVEWSSRLNDVKKYCMHAKTIIQNAKTQQVEKVKQTEERIQNLEQEIRVAVKEECWRCPQKRS